MKLEPGVKLELNTVKEEPGVKRRHSVAVVKEEPQPPEEDLPTEWRVLFPLHDAVGDGDTPGFIAAFLLSASDPVLPPRHPLDPNNCPGYYLRKRASLEQKPVVP